ncbi:MAG: polyprenyl synthetase family protein [Cyclobacteriaceae bacterium]|nr:polyprenyl synthetase family protein [Cyclobacteriaceae bacterium]
MKTWPEIQEIIQKEVAALDLSNEPANLYAPISYILSLGGKQLRPTLVLLACQLTQNDLSDKAKTALAVEVFHNFTLMHDDIMDRAPLRRGMPTVHEKWSQTAAILSGDAMLIKSYELLAGVGAAVLPTAFSRFNQTAREVCEGQQLDMDFENRTDVSEAEYLEMIRLKTAVLLGFSLELGAMMGGMSTQDQQKLYRVGESMGIGFQLMDDYLDVYADQSKFGKQVGGDILSNKKTFLLIHALARASSSQKKTISHWLGLKEFDPSEKIAAIMGLYEELHIGTLAQQRMKNYFDQAFALFDEVGGHSAARQELISFAGLLTSRDK